VGFSAAKNRTRGKKLGGSARQIVGGESPVNGNFDYDPGGTVSVHPYYMTGLSKPYVPKVRATSHL
jgi:hypothetical protein